MDAQQCQCWLTLQPPWCMDKHALYPNSLLFQCQLQLWIRPHQEQQKHAFWLSWQYTQLHPKDWTLPNFWLKLVLIRDTPKLTILDDLVELLSNHVKDLSSFIFMALLAVLETDLNPTSSFLLKNFKISPLSSPETSARLPLRSRHTDFFRPSILDLKVGPWKISQLANLPSSSWLVSSHCTKCW